MNWLKEYIASPTHKWWVDNVWKPSWTKFMTWVYGIPAALTTLAMTIGSLAGDNHIQDLLDKVHVPDWVPVGLAAIALIHYVASEHKDD